MRDSVADFETDYPGLAISSRAVNKLAKVVSSFILISSNLIILIICIFFGRCI